MAADSVGIVSALWRYPVKSMQGEELPTLTLTEAGCAGDRSHALIDTEDGTVVSAKNVRHWPNLLGYRARLTEGPPKAVVITLPDGREFSSTNPDINDLLTAALGRKVTLQNEPSGQPVLQQFHPDLESLGRPEKITAEAMLASTFFDMSVFHLLTTATLRHLESLYSSGSFPVRRFRPNLVLETPPEVQGFIENQWVGRVIRIGSSVRLRVTEPTMRCVMTTLSQKDAPKDLEILRAAVRHNQGAVGAYLTVLHGGEVKNGDPCSLE